jgi:hypothetical protein
MSAWEWRLTFNKESDTYKKYRSRKSANAIKTRKEWEEKGLCNRCGNKKDRYLFNGTLGKQCQSCYNALKGVECD